MSPPGEGDAINGVRSHDVTPKGARRIAQIIEAGTEILFEEGLRAVNKRKIAAKLGISDGNVSYYFPTRDRLWRVIVESELRDYYRRHHSAFINERGDAEKRFANYVGRWIDEYEDPRMRVFFSQILTVAELDDMVAEWRNEIYEEFFQQMMTRARNIVSKVPEAELQVRVLTAIALLEGLHAVSAFRPVVVSGEGNFRDRMIRQIRHIVSGV